MTEPTEKCDCDPDNHECTPPPPPKKTIAIDFDGVIHSYASGWTGYVPTDPPVPGAREFVNWLLDRGYEVVVFSTRARDDEGLVGIDNWLVDHGFPVGQLSITYEKPPAEAYVDDRAIRFEGRWELIQRQFLEVAHLAPWTTERAPLPATGTYSYSDVLEYYDAHEHPNRESAVAFAEAEYNPGQHFWTGLFRDVPLYEIAERLTNWYCDQESVADYLQEVLQEFVGEAAEDYYPDDDEYRLFKDDVRAAFLRLLHRPKSRPKMYQVTDVEQHRVPDDEEKEE